MAKKHLVDFVNKLKESGINISFTKPRSQFLISIAQSKHSQTITLKS